MANRVINTIASMFGPRKPKETLMSDDAEQLSLDLPEHNVGVEIESEEEKEIEHEVPISPVATTVLNILMTGEGSDKPELHVIFRNNGKTQSFVRPLSNPVTAHQIAVILQTLD